MLYSVKQLRQIEQSALPLQAEDSLMHKAGVAGAQAALTLLNAPNQPVLVLAGPGNNGGDAFEVAARLANAGHRVFVLHHPPKSARSADSANALARAQACGGITWLDAHVIPGDDYALVIDGLFGIGLSQKKISTILQKQITRINAMPCPVLALDVPSGLDADTGNVVTTIAIQASNTITFMGDKPGLHTCDGRDYAGKVEVADLRIAAQCFPDSDMELNREELFPAVLRRRRQNSSKGSNGSVHLIGGSGGMQGALILASRASLFCGAGRTLAGFVDAAPGADVMQPEVMCHPARQLPADDHAVVVIGPGLGNSVASFDLVSRALLSSSLLVMDADALNLMAQQPALSALCNGRDPGTTLITPHPLEAARLLGCTVEQVQADRIGAAKKLARRFSSVVILKGSGTVITQPKGGIVINPNGNAGLATGGSGDVLSGACGALIAQHKNIWQAALAATWLHGAAADSLVQRGIGPVGLSPGELILEIRALLNRCNAV